MNEYGNMPIKHHSPNQMVVPMVLSSANHCSRRWMLQGKAKSLK